MKKIIARLILIFLLAIAQQAGFSQVRLPSIVRDSMILQRDSKVKIWGWAAPGEKVRVQFDSKKFAAATGANGRWECWLPPLPAGGPHTLQIDASNHITLHNILMGDVWFCSGQSNMVHQMILHRERYAQEIAAANNPAIRHFFIPTLTSLQHPLDELPGGSWKWANPQDVGQFSAVAYFFALQLYEKYHVPIGLINASVGGTPIEAWTSEEGLREFPALVSTLQKNKDTAYINGRNRPSAAGGNPLRQDKGLTGPQRWYDPTFVPKGWRSINIPGYWEDQGAQGLDGVVWYRREIDVPASMTGMPAKIALGRIVDADFLYVNGIPAGNTTYQYPQRRYELPAGMLKPGKNILVVRVINNSGKGGFVPDKPYYLKAGTQTLDLKGAWQYKVGQAFVPQRPSGPGPVAAQNQPSALYNAMVAPLAGYTLKGFLWYQGESNTGMAAQYAQLLPALIADWRSRWQQPEAPFLYAQLPNFMDVQYLPSESQWAQLREAQLKTLSVPHTGMAVTIDAGEWNDIHPDDKKKVGDRLALAAENVAYGEKNGVYSGPLYQSAQADSNKIIITFNNTGGGLSTRDGEAPDQFAVAGADKKFVWAQAKIEGNRVVAWSEDVPHPVYVRYAWADNPDNPNLMNREGLPASPFRTDQ